MKEYWNENGQFHREDGPAIIWPDGLQAWYINGKLHRDDGPAIIWPNGSQEWWIKGQLHREDGPAGLYEDGTQRWFKHGKRHKKNGLPYILNKTYNTMTLANGEVVPMSADDYEKYRYKPTGRFTKAALREN